MNPLVASRRQYQEGTLLKPQFIDAMAEHHQRLFQYAEYLASTDISKIEITDGQVIMTTRKTDLRFACLPKDKRIAPIETLNFLSYEPDETAMMEAIISNGDTVFDIGANIGWYSLHFAKMYSNSQIYAFEPIPSTYECLRQNQELNKMSNIHAFNVGFANSTGAQSFYFYPEGTINASMENVSQHADPVTITCQIVRLDEFVTMNSIRQVDFIKCDVEGAELLVFQGARETLATMKPAIFTELLRKWSARFNYHPNELISLLEKLGYKGFTVNGTNLISFASMDEQTVETNFFFLHSERHRALIEKLSAK